MVPKGNYIIKIDKAENNIAFSKEIKIEEQSWNRLDIQL